MFIGRFKTGKSTIINTILGDELLPADVDECTAGVTFIQYGPELGAFTRSRDGRRQIPFTEYLTNVQAKNVSTSPTQPRVSNFWVRAPHELLRALTFVDTPGYDGVLPGSAARALAAIRIAARNADVCVFVLDHPISDKDLSVLREVADTCRELIMVLNRSDEFDYESVNQIRDFSLSVVHKQLGLRPS